MECPQTPYQAQLVALLTQDLLKDGSAAVSGVQNAMMELRMISNQPLLSRLHVQVSTAPHLACCTSWHCWDCLPAAGNLPAACHVMAAVHDCMARQPIFAADWSAINSNAARLAWRNVWLQGSEHALPAGMPAHLSVCGKMDALDRVLRRLLELQHKVQPRLLALVTFHVRRQSPGAVLPQKLLLCVT